MKFIQFALKAMSPLCVTAAFTLSAGAVPVSVELSSLRAIQTFDLNKGDDQAYLLVGGVAKGKEFMGQIPADKPWKVGPKTPLTTATELWKGDLGEGEFALVSVGVMHGKGGDAKAKEFAEKVGEAEMKVPARKEAKLAAAADFDKFAAENLKAQQGAVKDVKKSLSREAGTDHFGGLFNVLIWNDGGKIVKRIDPIGLTFGEHYGVDPKIYTKIKMTRANVMMKDAASGDWAEQEVTPLSDDENAIRVKMLETEPVKGATPPKHVTDYLAEVQVKADGKLQHWELGGDHPGPSPLHEYWDFAK